MSESAFLLLKRLYCLLVVGLGYNIKISLIAWSAIKLSQKAAVLNFNNIWSFIFVYK